MRRPIVRPSLKVERWSASHDPEKGEVRSVTTGKVIFSLSDGASGESPLLRGTSNRITLDVSRNGRARLIGWRSADGN